MGETDGAGALKTVLNAYAGQLGVDTRNRNFYILDGEGTSVLASSNGESGASGLSYTGNLMTAIESGQVGDESNAAADYMDVAIPIQRGGSDYIIYILDNKATVSNLNNQLFLLIMEALLFGLVISVLLSFLLSKTMITPIQRLTEGAMRVAEGTSPIRSRWPPGTRSACSPTPSTIWRVSSRTPSARWRTSATSSTPSFST